MELTLLVLAAGMGSRYGGLKQLDQLGPSGETVMDHSVYDAMRAGFNRVVFIIRRDFEEEFKKVQKLMEREAKKLHGKILKITHETSKDEIFTELGNYLGEKVDIKKSRKWSGD